MHICTKEKKLYSRIIYTSGVVYLDCHAEGTCDNITVTTSGALAEFNLGCEQAPPSCMNMSFNVYNDSLVTVGSICGSNSVDRCPDHVFYVYDGGDVQTPSHDPVT